MQIEVDLNLSQNFNTMVSVSENTAMQLEDVPIQEIKDKMEQDYASSYSKVDLISENENELIYNTRHQGRKTQIHLSRKPHRPLQLDIQVEYKDQLYAEEAFRSQSPFSPGNLKRLFIWALTVIVAVSLIVLLFLNGFNYLFTIFSENVLFLILAGAFVTIIYQVLPQRSEKRVKNFSIELQSLIDQIMNILGDLRGSPQISSKKCWNCFEEINPEDNVCAFCGKSQR